MATRYAGGSRVASGYYINARSFEFTNVEKDGGVLPGGADRKFVRIPTLAVIAAAPALGGLFVVAFPLLGFGMLGYAILRKLGGGAREVAATVASPTMPVGSTALTGRPAEPGATEGGDGAAGAGTDALAKEIAKKRAER